MARPEGIPSADALSSRTEWRRLRQELDHVGARPTLVWQAVHSAMLVAQYSAAAALRPSATDSTIEFGYLIARIWAVWSGDAPGTSITLSSLDRAVVTLGAFSGSSDSTSWRKGRRDNQRAALLHDVRRILGSHAPQELRGPGSGDMRSLLRLGESIQQKTGYDPIRDASRATRPWDALDSLIAATALGSPDSELQVPDSSDLLIALVARERTVFLRAAAEVLESPSMARAQGWLPHASIQYSQGYGQETLYAEPGAEIYESPSYVAEFAQPGVYPHARVAPADDDVDGAIYRVWFGTNRQASQRRNQVYFGDGRDSSASLHFGTCDVHIPKGHRFGTVKPAWYQRWTLLGSEASALKLINTQVHASPDQFVSSIRTALDVDDNSQQILLYVHGFNTTFRSAAIRAAQIGFDLKVEGVMAFFSWPSHGRLRSYLPDLREAEASRRDFEEFLHLLADNTRARTVNLIVHSMANKLVVESIQSLAASLDARRVKLGAVILAAPDVDVDLFESLAAHYSRIAAKTTMYVSSNDRALEKSGHKWSHPRAGFVPPVSVYPSIDTIEVSPIDLSVLGHGYYAQAAPVLNDIRAILDGHLDPDKRIRLHPRFTPPLKYWRFQP